MLYASCYRFIPKFFPEEFTLIFPFFPFFSSLCAFGTCPQKRSYVP